MKRSLVVGRGGTDKKRGELPAPTRLVARRFEAEGHDYVLFSWGTEAPFTPGIEASLTAAERSVLMELVSGRSNREIARLRRVSERTIANQVASILRKLGAPSRFALIRSYAGA